MPDLATCDARWVDGHAALERLGPELRGYLAAVLRDREVARDAWAMFAEQFLRSIGSFRGESSIRTWAYRIAHRTAARIARQRRRSREVLQTAPDVPFQPRTATSPWLRTDARDLVKAIREGLSENDRALLVLRIDRGLPWKEVSTILGTADATLRKRLERIKARIQREVEARGLLEEA